MQAQGGVCGIENKSGACSSFGVARRHRMSKLTLGPSPRPLSANRFGMTITCWNASRTSEDVP